MCLSRVVLCEHLDLDTSIHTCSHLHSVVAPSICAGPVMGEKVPDALALPL